jgi:hypothetical protein
MKLGILISEEVKKTLDKLSNEELPFDVCISIIKLTNLIKQKEAELEDARIAALLKYGTKQESGEIALDDNGNVNIKEELIELFAQELDKKYNEEVQINAIDFNVLEGKLKLNYTCRELIGIKEILQINNAHLK